MDELPTGLLLKIAGYCDFADVCAISKVNRRWNEVIESNWNSLKKIEVDGITFDQNDHSLVVQCKIRPENSGRNILKLIVLLNGFQDNVNASEILENGWITQDFSANVCGIGVRPRDVDKFLKDLFAPIFRRMCLRVLEVNNLKSSTFRVIISLLERFRPTVRRLHIRIGSEINPWGLGISPRIQEFADSARIVKLSKPDHLRFRIVDWFAEEDFIQHFLKRIANLYIRFLDMFWLTRSFHGPSRHLMRVFLHGPLPKCDVLCCEGIGVGPLLVPDIVDLVEEWSNNKRKIVRYELNSFPKDIRVVAAQIAEELKKRNLPVRFKVVEENEEFLIKKIATRGDGQDAIRLTVGFYYDDDEGEDGDMGPQTNWMRIKASQDIDSVSD